MYSSFILLPRKLLQPELDVIRRRFFLHQQIQFRLSASNTWNTFSVLEIDPSTKTVICAASPAANVIMRDRLPINYIAKYVMASSTAMFELNDSHLCEWKAMHALTGQVETYRPPKSMMMIGQIVYVE